MVTLTDIVIKKILPSIYGNDQKSYDLYLVKHDTPYYTDQKYYRLYLLITRKGCVQKGYRLYR